MIEEWKKIRDVLSVHGKNVAIEVSNFGRLKLLNGDIVETTYRQKLYFMGKQSRVHRVIAELFIPKTEEDLLLGRNCIDHITHNPKDVNINDVRNLRWCTYKENANFDEAKSNMKDPLKHPHWIRR